MYYSVLVYHGLPFYSAKSELPASTTLAVSTTPVVKGASEEIVKQLKDELSSFKNVEELRTECKKIFRFRDEENEWQVWRWKFTDRKSLKDFDNDKFLLALYYDLMHRRFVAMCANCNIINDYILAHLWSTLLYTS